MSNFGKILLFVVLFLILLVIFRSFKTQTNKEGFQQTERFLFKQGNDIYDDFYSEIYDYLVFNEVKDDYEIGQIINNTNPDSKSIIIDVGCGTGHHVSKLSEKNLNVLGIDISPSMVNKAKQNYPKLNFKVADVMDEHTFKLNSVTHIICLYFTIYYFKDKQRFFNNCMDWLMPGGFLIIHVVNRERFDPILPAGNPLFIVSPQKYAKERITKTKITFNEFTYSSSFDFNLDRDEAIFDEKFKFNNGDSRKNEHILYMESEQHIIDRAQDVGFLVHAKIDLLNCAYDHQFLYVLMKPS